MFCFYQAIFDIKGCSTVFRSEKIWIGPFLFFYYRMEVCYSTTQNFKIILAVRYMLTALLRFCKTLNTSPGHFFGKVMHGDLPYDLML